jgi:AcrR family transcriptional regulator
MKVNATRPYTMRARAEAAQATAERILDAALEAFGSSAFSEVTLQEIADRAGVTVQTIIRRFGSKDGLFDEVADRERSRVQDRREVPAGASLRRKVEVLVEHYEEDGDTVWRLIQEEDRSSRVARVVAEGRELHRSWVETHLAELAGSLRGAEYRSHVDAVVAATDLFTWRLLRCDLGRDKEEVVDVMVRILEGLGRDTR